MTAVAGGTPRARQVGSRGAASAPWPATVTSGQDRLRVASLGVDQFSSVPERMDGATGGRFLGRRRAALEQERP